MTTLCDIFTKPVLIFGCGNTLLGDDGLGPAVIDHLLANHTLPGHVAALDAGTSIREILFDLMLMTKRPRCIFIVDTVFESENPAGKVFEIDLSEVPSIKVHDFSLHQFPSVNLLSALRDEGGVAVRVLAIQAGKIPETIAPGLSEAARAAVPRACEWLIRRIGEQT
jgi:coenzyme F420 hydrogenase subunit delta